jgi:hypothetical protein
MAFEAAMVAFTFEPGVTFTNNEAKWDLRLAAIKQ